MPNVEIMLNREIELGKSIIVGGDNLTVGVHEDGMLVVDNFINDEGNIGQWFLPQGSWVACVAVRDKEED